MTLLQKVRDHFARYGHSDGRRFKRPKPTVVRVVVHFSDGSTVDVSGRESGGSILDAVREKGDYAGGSGAPIGRQSPVLNKSGGSKVPCGGDYYRPGSPHAKEGCTADDCKILGPLVNKSGGSDVEGK